MKINTVIFDIGGVMVGLGRLHFFEQFGYSPQMCERLLSSTMKSPHWKELDRGVLTDEEVIDRFVKDAPELETEIRRSMENGLQGDQAGSGFLHDPDREIWP